MRELRQTSLELSSENMIVFLPTMRELRHVALWFHLHFSKEVFLPTMRELRLNFKIIPLYKNLRFSPDYEGIETSILNIFSFQCISFFSRLWGNWKSRPLTAGEILQVVFLPTMRELKNSKFFFLLHLNLHCFSPDYEGIEKAEYISISFCHELFFSRLWGNWNHHQKTHKVLPLPVFLPTMRELKLPII